MGKLKAPEAFHLLMRSLSVDPSIHSYSCHVRGLTSRHKSIVSLCSMLSKTQLWGYENLPIIKAKILILYLNSMWWILPYRAVLWMFNAIIAIGMMSKHGDNLVPIKMRMLVYVPNYTLSILSIVGAILHVCPCLNIPLQLAI